MLRPLVAFTATSLAIAYAAIGCLSDSDITATPGGADAEAGSPITPDIDANVDTSEAGVPDDPTKNDGIKDSTQNITYRDDLTKHPGCTKDGTDARLTIDNKSAAFVAADIPGFNCSAKEYAVPANEDTTRPIVVLVHGNSSTTLDWETYAEDPTNPKAPQVAETLVADGWHVYAVDFRFDKVTDPTDSDFGNPGRNMDHGWTVPILEQMIRGIHTKYPTRKINLSGFSLGSTVIRDALRRMHHKGEKPFAMVHALHLISGASHGVSTFTKYCNDAANPANKTMRGLAACQLGNRDNYAVTPFLAPLNGPNGDWETPCADGIHAYGQNNVCDGNKVFYTTTVFKDPPDGPLQDEFVSEKSVALKGAENKTVTTEDTTNYFLNGAVKKHYGALRSAAGVALAKAALER